MPAEWEEVQPTPVDDQWLSLPGVLPAVELQGQPLAPEFACLTLPDLPDPQLAFYSAPVSLGAIDVNPSDLSDLLAFYPAPDSSGAVVEVNPWPTRGAPSESDSDMAPQWAAGGSVNLFGPTPTASEEADGTSGFFTGPGHFPAIGGLARQPPTVAKVSMGGGFLQIWAEGMDVIPDSGIEQSPYQWLMKFLRRGTPGAEIQAHLQAIGTLCSQGAEFERIVSVWLERISMHADRPRGPSQGRFMRDARLRPQPFANLPQQENQLLADAPANDAPGLGIRFDVDWDNMTDFKAVLDGLHDSNEAAEVGNWQMVQLWGQF
jgi:hypothetical protein